MEVVYFQSLPSIFHTLIHFIGYNISVCISQLFVNDFQCCLYFLEFNCSFSTFSVPVQQQQQQQLVLLMLIQLLLLLSLLYLLSLLQLMMLQMMLLLFLFNLILFLLAVYQLVVLVLLWYSRSSIILLLCLPFQWIWTIQLSVLHLMILHLHTTLLSIRHCFTTVSTDSTNSVYNLLLIVE